MAATLSGIEVLTVTVITSNHMVISRRLTEGLIERLRVRHTQRAGEKSPALFLCLEPIYTLFKFLLGKGGFMTSDNSVIPVARIEKAIFRFRGLQVMIDRDLAELYQVETKVLNQAVKRNAERFPEDFMFQLNQQEFENWKSQIVTSNSDKMGLRRRPYAFTEQGVAMLSSVLRSPQAVQVNIEIMRAFVSLRAMTADHKALARRLNKLEEKYDKQFAVVFDAIREMMNPPEGKKQPIGFVRRKGSDDD